MYILIHTLVIVDILLCTILNDIYYNDNEYHVLQRIPQYRYDDILSITAVSDHVQAI